jgi:hypothetical protein
MCRPFHCLSMFGEISINAKMWMPMTRPFIVFYIFKICFKWFLMCYDCMIVITSILGFAFVLHLLITRVFFAIGTRWIMHCFSFWFSTKDHANLVWDLKGGSGPISLVWSWSKFVDHWLVSPLSWPCILWGHVIWCKYIIIYVIIYGLSLVIYLVVGFHNIIMVWS